MPYHAIRDPEQLQALLDAVLAIESDLELSGMLRRIVSAGCLLTRARYGALGVLDTSGKGLAEFVHVGFDDATAAAIGHPPRGAGLLGTLILHPEPLRLADLAAHPDSVGFPLGHPPMRTFLGVPIRVPEKIFGNLYLTEKEGGIEFTGEDEVLVTALASAAGVVVHTAQLQARLEELILASDRERIARELHDTVVQRLFAVGLSLQSVVPVTEVPKVREYIGEAVTLLDETIRQIRTTIFALEPLPAAGQGLRRRALDVCAEATRSLGFDPEVRFSGAVDRLVTARIATEALSSLREALSNVARHARASRVEVELSVDHGEVRLCVRDDGVGPGEAALATGRGVHNMAERAELLGGSFTLARRPEGGSQCHWSVPLVTVVPDAS